MRFIVDLYLDGYETKEEMNEACREYIHEQLNSVDSIVEVLPQPTAVPEFPNEELKKWLEGFRWTYSKVRAEAARYWFNRGFEVAKALAKPNVPRLANHQK